MRVDRASDDHCDADATQMGDERFTRVVDDRDRAWPSSQIRSAGFEQPSSRNHHEAGALEFLRLGQTRGAFVDGYSEFREQVGKFGEFTVALEQHGPIV